MDVIELIFGFLILIFLASAWQKWLEYRKALKLNQPIESVTLEKISKDKPPKKSAFKEVK